jgi:hypothetical protein
MSSALYIAAEREVEGLDISLDGKSIGKCRYLNGLAALAGVRPLMEFFGMSPDEFESVLEEEEPESPPEEHDQTLWFEADEGLVTVRALLSRLEAGPVELPNDPVLEGSEFLEALLTDFPNPEPSDLIEDLREFESVLARLAAEGVRWHLAVDF